MELRVSRHFNVPQDLAKQYDEKIFEINRWLEAEMVKRGVAPTIFYFVSTPGGKNFQLARTEPK